VIDLYTWPTPNGHKIHIMLEETGLEYRTIPVNIRQGDQFGEAFLWISPNNKIPAIVDYEGVDGAPLILAESGAILIYLGEKTGQFYPADLQQRFTCLQWLMTQVAHVGPMLGKVLHFSNYAPEHQPYAIQHFKDEGARLYRILNQRLGESEYLAGPDYTIADIATFAWLRGWQGQGQDLPSYPHLTRWFEAIAARPAVQRGCAVLADKTLSLGSMTDAEREVLFGGRQYAPH
jgi:GST-like protein